MNKMSVGGNNINFIFMRGLRIVIPHEDKVGVFTPFIQHIVQRWRICDPHEDKVDVFTPTNILFKGGGEF